MDIHIKNKIIQDVSLLPQRHLVCSPWSQKKPSVARNLLAYKNKRASETWFHAASPNLAKTNLLSEVKVLL